MTDFCTACFKITMSLIICSLSLINNQAFLNETGCLPKFLVFVLVAGLKLRKLSSEMALHYFQPTANQTEDARSKTYKVK